MRIKFIFDNGSTVEIGEDDWIGAIAYHDLPNRVWTESCSGRKALIKALNARMTLYLNHGVREFNIDSRVVAEAWAIDGGEETLIWRRAVRSSS